VWDWNDDASLPIALFVGKIQTRYSPSSRLAGRAPRRPNPEVSPAGRTPEIPGGYPLLESPETPHELPTWGTRDSGGFVVYAVPFTAAWEHCRFGSRDVQWRAQGNKGNPSQMEAFNRHDQSLKRVAPHAPTSLH
jgi:hypothetical protein